MENLACRNFGRNNYDSEIVRQQKLEVCIKETFTVGSLL
jgi:hypothetical protein